MRKNSVEGKKSTHFVIFYITLYLVIFGSFTYAVPTSNAHSLKSYGNTTNRITETNHQETSNLSSVAFLGDIEVIIWEVGVVEVNIVTPDEIQVKWHDIGKDRVQGIVQINYSIISYLNKPLLPCNIIIASLISLKHRDNSPYIMKTIRPIQNDCVEKNCTITNDVIVISKDEEFDIEAILYALPQQLWRGLLYGRFSKNQKTVTVHVVKDDDINHESSHDNLGENINNTVYMGDAEITLGLNYKEESNNLGTINITINNVTKWWQRDSAENISGLVGLNWSIYSVKDFKIPWIIWIEIRISDIDAGEIVGAILYGSSHKYNASSNNGTLYAPIVVSPQGRNNINLEATLRVYVTPQTLRYSKGLSLKRIFFLPLATSGILTSGLLMVLSGISVQLGMPLALGALYVTLLSIGSLGIVINGMKKESASITIQIPN